MRKLGLPNVFGLRKTDVTPNTRGVGEIRYADGTVWNPGQGKGYYYWNGTLWVFMGTSLGGDGVGWRDQLGEAIVKTPGANDPTWTTYRGNLKQLQFSNAKMTELFFAFHVQHDYKPGSDMYLHVHWSQIVVDSGGAAGVPGVAKWYWDVSYAKGYDQAAFSSPITTSVTQTASSVQYQHMIAEVQLSAASPSASQLDSDDLEVDGLIIVRLYRDSTDPADTLNQGPFVHYSDLHYQVDRLATKNRNFNFYT